VAAADDPERQAESKNDAPGRTVTVSLPRVDQVRVDGVRCGVGAGAEDPVLAVQHHIHVIRAESPGSVSAGPMPRLTYSPSCSSAAAPGGHLLTGQAHRATSAGGGVTVISRLRFCYVGGVHDVLGRRTPGQVAPEPGQASPGSTSSATSTMVMRPAMAPQWLSSGRSCRTRGCRCRSPLAAATRRSL